MANGSMSLWMPFSDTRGCPHCHGSETEMVAFTRMGVRHYSCPECGHRWNLTVEDEVLGYTGERRKSTAADRRSRNTPGSPSRYPTEE
jgi:transposase-like protein